VPGGNPHRVKTFQNVTLDSTWAKGPQQNWGTEDHGGVGGELGGKRFTRWLGKQVRARAKTLGQISVQKTDRRVGGATCSFSRSAVRRNLGLCQP